MIQISTLEYSSPETLFTAFSAAFADYAHQWSAAEFHRMLQRRGYDPALSFGAFDGARLVSFIFNAGGRYDGKATVYDTGTGTIPAYRGRQLSTQLFRESIPVLEKAGMQQYLLEVLQDNDTAIGIYRRAGFSVRRSFHYFTAMPADVDTQHKNLPPAYMIRPAAIDPLLMEPMWDFTPSWQNSFTAIGNCAAPVICLGAWQDNVLRGYGILEPASGDISQLAVHPDHRRSGIGTALLQHLLQYNKSLKVKMINADSACAAFSGFAERSHISRAGSQYEMILDLG